MSRFDEIIERVNTDSEKYDFADRYGKPEGLIPLWVADMDFQAPEEVRSALREKAEHGIFGYSDVKDEYYEKIISWFNKRHNWFPKQEWIIKTPGVIFAISAAVRAFTEPGDAVIIQTPVYRPFYNCVRENGRRLIQNELEYNNGRYEMDLENFERQVTQENVKLFILCSPHNPVGRVWTREELAAVGGICMRHGVFVISDEIHCDFVYSDSVHSVFAGLSEEFADRSMICTAPSKTFNLAGLQASNIFIKDESYRKRLKRQLYLTGYEELNIFALTGCRAAYAYGGPWLDELLLYLKGNLRLVSGYLKEKVPEIRLVEPEGTYLLWLDCGGLGLTGKELEEFMTREAGLWLSPGENYGENAGRFQRLNMACPRSVLQKALEQLRKAVDAKMGGSR